MTRGEWAESFFTLTETFLSVYNEFSLLYDDLSHRCGCYPRGWKWLQPWLFIISGPDTSKRVEVIAEIWAPGR